MIQEYTSPPITKRQGQGNGHVVSVKTLEISAATEAIAHIKSPHFTGKDNAKLPPVPNPTAKIFLLSTFPRNCSISTMERTNE